MLVKGVPEVYQSTENKEDNQNTEVMIATIYITEIWYIQIRSLLVRYERSLTLKKKNTLMDKPSYRASRLDVNYRNERYLERLLFKDYQGKYLWKLPLALQWFLNPVYCLVSITIWCVMSTDIVFLLHFTMDVITYPRWKLKCIHIGKRMGLGHSAGKRTITWQLWCHWNNFEEYRLTYHQNFPDSNFHGANMGPIWGRQDPCGPRVGPMNFAIWG